MSSTVAYATPGEARTGVIDFNTTDGTKYYSMATKGLEEKYDLKPDGLKAFLDNVRQRAVNYGFTNVLNIPTLASLAANKAATAAAALAASTTPATAPPATPGGTTTTTAIPLPRPPTTTYIPPLVYQNLLTTYGSITMTECQEVAKGYYGPVATRDRMCQNSSMLYNFVRNSITSSASNELALEESKYMIGGQHADGACFLKLLISKVQVDTQSTVNVLRASVSRLGTKITEFKGDIKAFHNYVKTLTTAMASYGQDCPELMVNLFEAYLAVEDESFRHYVMSKQNDWEDGSWKGTPTTIMNLVENHYKIRVEKGTWKTVNKRDERIVALEAEILALRSNPTRTTGRGMTKEEKDKKYAWKLIAPTSESGKKEVKTFEGRQYHWCTKHKSWTLHTDAQCKGVGASKNRGTKGEGQVVNSSEASNPIVKVDTALSASTDHEPLVL